MKLYLGGTEVSDHRKMLTEQGVMFVSLSYAKLAARVKFAKPWLLSEHYAEDQSIFLDSGAYTFNKEGSDLTEDDAMELATNYMSFVVQNLDRISLVSEFDALMLGRDWLNAMREDFWDELGDKFLPIWHAESGRDDLEALASKYSRVGIYAKEIDDKMLPMLRDIVQRHGTKLHGVSMTKIDVMAWEVWDSVGSNSWISPSQYGDTIVWMPNNELKRYPMRYKDQCRSRNRAWFEQNGFDAQAIIDDDRKEVLRLSVWSWQHYIDYLNHRKLLTPFGSLNHPAGNDNPQFAEGGITPLDHPLPGVENEHLLPAVREPREIKLIPVMAVHSAETEDGESENLLATNNTSLMQCNNCYIRDLCPEMKPDASCAYSIPVEVTSKRQMRALQDTLISLQTKRVMTMSLMEQVKGGYADANVGVELDRLQRMIKHKWEAEKSGFRLTIEADGPAKDGILSNLLGRDVGDTMSEMDEPIDAQEAMENMNIIDAEVVEGN